MIKVGLVGLGFIGRMHLSRILDSEQADLVAVADLDLERLCRATAEGTAHPALLPLEIPEGVATFATLDDMLQGAELDVVDVCLPTFLHAESTVKAAEAGKHVLCEKPMALTLDECQAMIDAASANGVQLMVAQCIRFWPEYVYLKDTYDSQRLGRLQSLSLRRVAAPPTWSWEAWLLNARRSGGAIVDLHIHDVDFINFMLGPPRAVFAQGIEQGITGGIDVMDLTKHHTDVGHGDLAVRVIAAIAGDETQEFHVNVPNEGAITNLPAGAIVEVPALVDAGGVTPLCMGQLSKGVLGLTQSLVAWEELTVDAALSGDRDLVLQAVLAHPWVHSAAQAEGVCDEMFAAHAAHLPQFFGH